MVRSVFPRLARRTPAAVLRALLLGVLLATATADASAAGLPAGCTPEAKLSSGAPDPASLCVSYGYGTRPTGTTGPATRNVVAYAEGRIAMPFDYYVRTDLAEQIAAGTARPRGTYLLLFGGAFICGSRVDLASQARELARRGYVVVAPEYPLSESLSAYGYYNPNAPYSQAQVTQRGANPCADFATWTTSSAFAQQFLAPLRARGLEPVLQQGQWVLQALIRVLKRDPSYGVDPKRIFAIGSSAGGAEAIRLAFGGNQDALPSGADPGDSTIAGAVSISGPACFPGSRLITTPMLLGAVKPSDVPACRSLLDAADPQVVMIQEPIGGKDDPVVPTVLMANGCLALNNAGFGRKCIYEGRPPGHGGYIADGDHAAPTWGSWLELFNALAAGGVGQP